MFKPTIDPVNKDVTVLVEESIVTAVRAVSVFPFWTNEEMTKAQEDDSDIGPVFQLITEGKSKPPWCDVSDWSSESKILLVDWDKLEIHEGMLYRKWLDHDKKTSWFQIALPRKFREAVLEHLHDSLTAGHGGVH